ncbi:hypothetical protein TomTYG75_06790 [Sphingobium sp. TomTYG75]
MTFTPEQNAALSAPLNRDHVAKRQQGGSQVSYIEGWHAIAEANRIFGFDGWQRETIELRQLGEPRDVNGKMRVDYLARVRITVGNLVREGSGFGQGIDKDVGQAHESALKEAETDAMKRAFMTFGNPFGLALYDKTQSNVQDAPPPTITEATLAAIKQAIGPSGVSVQSIVEGFKVSALDELTAAQGEATLRNLQKRIAQNAQKEAA